MPLVPCLCTSCGAPLEVDDSKEAAICKFCGTPFIVEKAINNYKTINVTMNAKDEQALIRKGLRMLESPYYDKDELAKIGEELSDISTNDFYPEFFFFAALDKDNEAWLLKNARGEEKKALAKFCFNGIIRDYNKESFDEIKLNIAKNYYDVNFDAASNDRTYRYIHLLDKLQDVFDTEMSDKWNKLKEMAVSELEELSENIPDMKTAILIISYARAFAPIVDVNTTSTMEEKAIGYAKYASSKDFMDLYKLAQLLDDKSLFHVNLCDDFSLNYEHLIYKNHEYPLNYALRYANDDTSFYLLLQLDDSNATVIRVNTPDFNGQYQKLMPNLEKAGISFFDSLTSYRTSKIEGSSLHLVYKEGISYKKSKMDKLFGFIGSFIK